MKLRGDNAGAVRQRFPKSRRLSDEDFASAIRSGKSVRGQGVAILLKKNESGVLRLGMVVPKRIVARSVDRSRSKRVFREWFRQNEHRLQGHDLVIRMTSYTKGKLRERALLAEIERLISANS